MLPSEVERKLLTVLRHGKVKVKGILKKSAAEFFFSDHWSFNKNITHTCSHEISSAAKRLAMGISFFWILFLSDACRLPEWMHPPSTVLKKMNLFWDTLDSKNSWFKKRCSTQKKENDINLEWSYHYNILQQWILTILQPFSPLPRHCQRSVPKSSVVLSQASKTSFQSQRGVFPFSRFRFATNRWGPVLEALGAAGRFCELNCTKANYNFCHNRKKIYLLYIYTFQCISWNIYMLDHVESCWKNWQANAWVGSFWG